MTSAQDALVFLSERADDATLLVHEDGRILAANPAAAAILGRSQTELAAARLEDVLLVNEPRPNGSGTFAGTLRGARENPTRVRGRVFAGATGQQGVSLYVFTDPPVAPALRELHTHALAATANAVIITNRSGIIEWVNPAFTELTGFEAAEALGRTPRILRSDEHPPEFYRDMWSTILAGRVWRGETRNRRKDGSGYVEEQTITPVRDAAGEITHFIAVKQDVTQRRLADERRARAEAELRLSETRCRELLVEQQHADEALRSAHDKLRAVIEASPVGIIALDRTLQIQTWNTAAQRIVGESGVTLVGSSVAGEILEQWPELAHLRDRVLRGETVRGLELDWNASPTVSRSASLSAAPLYDAAQRVSGILVAIDDIGTRRQLERQLLASQKMEAIGRLAGGVAHDFNNLLTVIITSTDFLLEDLGESDPRRGDAHEVRKAAERATALTRQLLAFSRRQVIQPRVLTLNTILADTEKMLRRLIGEDIELVVSRHPELGRVKADPAQIDQVVVNLVVNARDAMPKGGTLSLATSNVAAVEGAGVLPAGEWIRLTVRDTGHGMDEATKTRIFEPFFTTKERGKGTGLGLATVYGIVKQAGGYVFVDSEPGKGATFSIYLPRVEDVLASDESGVRGPPIPSGSETILLVEDETPVRSVARRILEHHGYRILEAGDGETALSLFTSSLEPIHLLLTDVVMPKMSGRELADRLAHGRPGLRVLFMSGYTGDALATHGVLESGVILVSKPFTPGSLARKVREALDGGAHGPPTVEA